jgi:hypothetical protein
VSDLQTRLNRVQDYFVKEGLGFDDLCLAVEEAMLEISALRAAGGVKEKALIEQSSKLETYQRLCPSVQDLETGEQLHPESTIQVGLGRYRKLIDDADRLADKVIDLEARLGNAERDFQESYAKAGEWQGKAIGYMKERDVLASRLETRSTLLAEIVAYFDVLDNPMSQLPEWPTDWIRRAKALDVERQEKNS